MSQPRRALLADSGIAEDAIASPRRSASPRLAGKLALPTGIAAPLAAVLAVSMITTAAGAPAQTTATTTTESAAEVAARVAARGTYTQTSSVTVAQEKQITRDQTRPTLSNVLTEVALKAAGTRYTTTDLTVRQTPAKDAKALGTLSTGTGIKITDATFGAYRQVIYNGKAGWVLNAKLTSKKPSGASGSVTSAECRLGSAVESGLKANTIKIYRSLCANFPKITSYGGVRADSLPYHPSGRALDAMLPSVSDSALGWQMAEFLVAHASEFNIDHIIFRQQLWVPGQGWSAMEDRGSTTANHYDHVHVAVASN